MANRAHLQIIKKGVEAFLAWRAAHPDSMLDLSKADLKGLSLVGLDATTPELSPSPSGPAKLIAGPDGEGLNSGVVASRPTSDIPFRSAFDRSSIESGCAARQARNASTPFLMICRCARFAMRAGSQK